MDVMNNRLPWPLLRAKIISMADSWADEDISTQCSCSMEEVKRALADVQSSGWWLQCRKSGRTWITRNSKAAYRIVCLQGLVDWDWGAGKIVGEEVRL